MPTRHSTHHAAHAPNAEPAPMHFSAAFADTAAARAALTENDLLPITLDVQAAVATVIGALPHLAKLRHDIGKLPGIDVERLDKLKTFAEALFFANIEYLAASGTGEALPKLAARAVELRDLLLSDAAALAKRGLIDGTPLGEIKKTPGYLNTATDVGVVVRVLRERWADIAAKTAVQPADLDEAEAICERITVGFAGRSNVTTEAEDAANERQRAYTLMVGAYDQARRAATFLRWDENDVDAVIPSLWAGRARPTKASDAQPAAAAGTPAPAPKPASAVTPKAPAPDAPAATPATPVASGLPGTSPFSTN